MSKVLEVESKWILSREDYDALLASCRILKTVDQLNIYFDDNWSLAQIGATCRIRLAPGEQQFTLKFPAARMKENARSSWEINLDLREVFDCKIGIVHHVDVSSLPRSATEALTALDVSHLDRVGRMRNKRRVVEWPGVGRFELDSFCLPGNEWMFEAEIETEDDDLRRALIAAVRRVAPNAKPSEKSKFQRFREAAERAARSRVRAGMTC